MVSVYGSATAAAGFLWMGWGPRFLIYFGVLHDPLFASASMIRLAGAGFFMAGLLLLALRPLQDARVQRRIVPAMAAANILGALIVWSQQIAIWETRLGLILTLWLWLAAAGFGLFAFLNGRVRA
jgi:hypothetical protein